MRSIRLCKVLVVTLACLGTVLPTPFVRAAEPGIPAAVAPGAGISDVALHEGGVLIGCVFGDGGLPNPGAAVTILQGGQRVAETRTDMGGAFRVESLRGGCYQLVAADHVAVFRAWAPMTAPPSAKAVVLVVPKTVVRGQSGAVSDFLRNPWVISGVILTAIAIPVAIAANRADREPSS